MADMTTLVGELLQSAVAQDDFHSLAPRLEDSVVWESDAFDGAADRTKGGEFLAGLQHAFPDLQTDLIGPVFELGSTAVFEFQIRGTHTGFMPDVGITNKKVVLNAIGIAEFNGEKLASIRTYWNCTAFLAQLGIRPHMRPDPVGMEYGLKQGFSPRGGLGSS